MAKSKFGAENFKPHQLGPEPAAPATAPEPAAAIEPAAPGPQTRARNPAREAATPAKDAKLRDIKVQFTSRASYAAVQQLKALAKEGQPQSDLLAEALNLLFKKRGLEEVA